MVVTKGLALLGYRVLTDDVFFAKVSHSSPISFHTSRPSDVHRFVKHLKNGRLLVGKPGLVDQMLPLRYLPEHDIQLLSATIPVFEISCTRPDVIVLAVGGETLTMHKMEHY